MWILSEWPTIQPPARILNTVPLSTGHHRHTYWRGSRRLFARTRHRGVVKSRLDYGPASKCQASLPPPVASASELDVCSVCSLQHRRERGVPNRHMENRETGEPGPGFGRLGGGAQLRACEPDSVAQF